MDKIIHCNVQCGRLRELDKCGYFFTACGHILCYECNSKVREDTCPVCKKQTKSIKLESLDPTLGRMYFGDHSAHLVKAVETLQKQLENFNNIDRFRKFQERSYSIIVEKTIKRLREMVTKESNELQALKAKTLELEALVREERQKSDRLKRQMMDSSQQRHGNGHTNMQNTMGNASMFGLPPSPRTLASPGSSRMNGSTNSVRGIGLDRPMASVRGVSGRVYESRGSNFDTGSARLSTANRNNDNLFARPRDIGGGGSTRMPLGITRNSLPVQRDARYSPTNSVGGRTAAQTPNSLTSGMYFRSLMR